MFCYPGFGYISYSEIPGQFRYDIAAVQKKFVFRMQWLYTPVSFIKSCRIEDNSDMCWLLNMLKSKKRAK